MSNKANKRSGLIKVIIAVIAVIIVFAGIKFGFGKGGNIDNDFDLPTVADNGELTGNASEDITYSSPAEEMSDEPITDEYSYDENYEVEVSAESEYEYYLTFYNEKRLNEHYEKHGKEMGFSSPEEYEKAANKVVTNSEALHKTEKEDGDDVYYLESTNEFVIVSTDGYIRTYFLPDGGLAYFNRQ